MALDVLEDSFICGGFPPNVVFRCEPVDGNSERHSPELRPFERNWPDGAGDDLSMDIARLQYGQNLIEFPIAHQWFSTYDGHMERTVFLNHLQYAVDEFLAAKIADLPQDSSPA
jgi:hypothetical protein